jgi:hypothetical protein
MISPLGVIIIAVGASVCVFVAGAVSVVLLLRANDRKRQSKEEVARQLCASQRDRLSVGSTNYAHVPEPRATLRKSTHVPYGLVTEGWASIPSRESVARSHRVQINERPEELGATTKQKRRRSLRASLTAHSFSLPKTRRQVKIEKAVPLRAIPRSPLSAITERSGTNTTEASPSVGVVELPTEITPKTTPEKDQSAIPTGRPMSLQWPLTTSNRLSWTGAPTIIPVPASRNSTLMRVKSTQARPSPLRPSLRQRSISMTSTFSVAPEDPLPPLPSITPNEWSVGPKSRLRLSAASFDTIGSSVLGGGLRPPSHTETDLTSFGRGSPPIDLNPIELQAFERQSQSWDSATVITTGSPKAKHATKYRNGKGGYGSFRATIGNHLSTQNTTHERDANSADRSSFLSPATGPSLSAGDPGKRRSDLSCRANSVRSCVSLSPPIPVARTGSGYRRGTVAVRHSMYEQDTTLSRFSTDSAVLRDVSGNPASPIRRLAGSRPTSVASENPGQWDRNSLQMRLSSSSKSSPASQRIGHKRQNCVRISNIPVEDLSRRSSKLPQMTEEEEDTTDIFGSKTVTIPGLGLLEQEKPDDDTECGQEHINNTSFLTRSIVEPTTWQRPQYPHSLSSGSIVSRKRDSDVFSSPRYDPSAPNIFTENSTPGRQWPLTPIVRHNGRPQPTPPSLKPNQNPYDPDSPTLPTPAISSATLFARALPLGARVSAVQGPRDFPTPGRLSRPASPSPMTTRAATRREDPRRSVMTSKSMNFDAKDKPSMAQKYRNMGTEGADDLLDSRRHGEEHPTARLGVRGVTVTIGNSSPGSQSTHLQVPHANKQHRCILPHEVCTLIPPGLDFSKSRRKAAPSTSTMSARTTSIWEDASVPGSSDPEMSTSSSKHPTSPSQPGDVDVEAFENLVGRGPDRIQGSRKDGDRMRESRLTSPHGKDLGLVGVQVQAQTWDTPRSLYDGDGFLME